MEGNTPEALVGVPPEWTPDQIGQFQQYWDSLLAGDLGQRRHTRFVPGGLEYHPTREVTLKDQFDEWLARVVCFAFSVSPSAFIAQVNRATAQTAQQTAEAEGLQPLKLWLKSLVDRLIEEDFGWGDLEFSWSEENAPDPSTLMTINTGYVAAGIKTVDEARSDIGLGPIAGGDRATPMIPTMQRYDPSEPRDERGRWTTGDGSPKKPQGGSAHIIPVQLVPPISLPDFEIPELNIPDWLTRPEPGVDLGPGIMPYTIPDGLSDEEKKACLAEWDKAYGVCLDLKITRQLKRKDRRFGRNFDECVRGQVSEKCGGNEYDKSPKKPIGPATDLEA